MNILELLLVWIKVNNMSIRELMIEYILFAFTDEELMSKFQVTEEEVSQLCDMDLLEMYDQTLLTPVTE